MELNGKAVPAALDTGAFFTGINWKAANLAGIEKGDKSLREFEDEMHGMNSTNMELVTEGKVKLSLKGKVHINDYQVRIKDVHALTQFFGDKPGMILGMPFLEEKRLIIDYQNNNLYFKSSDSKLQKYMAGE